MLPIIHKFFDRFGYKIVPKDTNEYRSISDIHSDSDFIEIYNKCKDYTMTSLERMYSLYAATQYVVNNNIKGDMVECGVWRGGSIMLIALTLKKMGVTDKRIYLYDTFSGMPKPQEIDTNYLNIQADKRWEESKKKDYNEWCYASLDEVKKNLYLIDYPQDKFEFIVGKVEDTIPKVLPIKISLLRLDTDWYQSVYHCLNHLFPLLSEKGAIIIDDYGHWQGAKQATDKYIDENRINILLSRIDYTGRIGIKI